MQTGRAKKLAEWGQNRLREQPVSDAPVAKDAVPVSAMDRSVAGPRFGRKQALLAGLLAIAAGASAYAYFEYGIARSLTIDVQRVSLSTVHAGTFNEFIPVTGRIEPRDTVFIDAVDGGQVAAVLVEEGAMVESGQPLVRLNNTNLQLEVIAREAQISEQLNRLASTKLLFEQTRLGHARELIDVGFRIDQSTQQLGRIEALANTGAIRRADIEDARLEITRLGRLQEELTAAQAVDKALQAEQILQLDQAVDSLSRNLTLARESLDNLVLKAPLSGQLTSLDANLGESKQRGQRIGQIDQLGSYKVAAWIDEHYLDRVAPGQHATVELANETFQLELTKVYPEVRDRQFRIDLDFEAGQPGSIRRGQSLQLRLAIGVASESLMVANGPFFDDTGGQWAFVLDESGNAARRDVRLGRRNVESIEVLGGLSPGDRVVTSSYDQLLDIDQLRLTGDP
jgi:HlyD family secretion protein